MEYKVDLVLIVVDNIPLIECIRIHVEGYLIEYILFKYRNEHKLRTKSLVRYLKGKSYIFEKDNGQSHVWEYNTIKQRYISYSDVLKLGLERSHIAQLYKIKLSSYKSKPKKEPNQFKLMSRFLHGRK